MRLKELIEELEKHHPAKHVPLGFGRPHSYRGYYEQLAFSPVENTTVGDMLNAAKTAMGKTFTGYKGGEYEMGEWTECNLAEYGSCGETIGPVLLRYMLGEVCLG
jgi:hypothetical protein